MKYGSRKWILALLILAITVIARWMEWIDGAQLVNLLASTMLFYGAANVSQKALTKAPEL